jgi:Family of unknown function (DUF5681)
MNLEPASEQDGRKSAAPIQRPNVAAPVAGYKVGPGCPPKEYQFKKGQSGNPNGAKPKAPSLAPDLKKLLEQALDRTITLTQGEESRTLTLFAAGIEQLVKQYVKGDRHARKELFALAQQVGLDLFGIQKEVLEKALTANQQAMLYEYVAKQYDLVAQRAPVLAPAALLDDDNDDQNRG